MTTPDFSHGFRMFVDAISNYLDFLFAEFGFAVVHQEDSWGEHGLVILESRSCRLKAVFDRGAIEVFLGRSDAPPTWSSVTEGRRAWFYLRTVVDFLKGRPKRSLAELLAEAEPKKLSEWSDLAGAAEILRPVPREAWSLLKPRWL